MSLQNTIETAFENRAEITPQTVSPEVKEAVLETLRQLDNGSLRVAERLGVGQWKVNEWAKKAVLLCRQKRGADAFLCEHRRVCGRGRDGGHLGDRGFVRANR